MSIVMAAGTRPVPASHAASPHDVQEVIERHLEGLEGLPTPEIVTAICAEFASDAHKVKVLRFFLLETPLRGPDLRVMLCNIGQNRASLLCREVARMREERRGKGKKPRWE